MTLSVPDSQDGGGDSAVTLEVVITDGPSDLPELQEAGWIIKHVLSHFVVNVRIID
jgi:hypothetical protein